MDDRVIAFRNRFYSYQYADEFPAVAFREEILILHDVVEDEASRLELMAMFNILCTIIERHLAHNPETLANFRIHRAAQITLFLRAESLVDDEIDLERLQYVTAREIAAGRMSEDHELRRYAMGDPTAYWEHRDDTCH